MSDSRALILERIRKGLGGAVLPQAAPSLSARPVPDPAATGLAESFRRELEAVGGEFFAPPTREAACAQTVALLRAAGGTEVLAWAEEELPLPGLATAVEAAGLSRRLVRLSAEAVERRRQTADLDRPLAGLTGALGGLADTGSLALLSGPGRPRAASLLPLVHVALLPVGRLYASMAAFLAAQPGVTRGSSNLVYITGPSRTADIELILTRGVHGPGKLQVVLVPEA